MVSDVSPRIAVVDRSPIFARAVAEHLEHGLQTPDARIEIISSDDIAGITRPDRDMVLLDPYFVPRIGQIAAELLQENPDIALFAIATNPTQELVRYCFENGFRSFASKSLNHASLLRAVRVTLSGGSFIEREFGRDLFVRTPGPTEGRTMTEREESILRLSAQGYPGSRIADIFGLSPKTIDTYRSRAMDKLGLKDRPALIRMASARGWLD